MKVSVIIPTYNPALHVERTIDSLVPQAQYIHQLTVIIDNEQHAGYIDLLTNKYKTKFNVLTVKAHKNVGRAKSRNEGAALSEGELLLFLDDDMLAECNLIEGHVQYHIQHPETIVVGNGYRNPADAKDSFGKYIVHAESAWQKGMEEVTKVSYNHFVFTACNMSIPVIEFKRLNGFDERLKDAEDFDLGVNALNHAMNIIYVRALKAWHDDWPTIEKFVDRHNEYTKAKWELLKLHPDYARSFPQVVPGQVSSIKGTILGMLKGNVFAYAMSNSIVKILPLKLKFLFYRFTIAAHSVNTKAN